MPTELNEFPGYFITKDGQVTHGQSKVDVRYTRRGAAYVRIRDKKGKGRDRSLNVLLVETFGPGSAEAAGFPEPNMKRVAVQRDLAKRPRSGKSLGKDGTGYRQKTRRCHDCRKPTNNYRCSECWAKIRGTAPGFGGIDEL